jgi:hypothetical protein
MFVAVPIVAEGADQHQVVPDVQPVDLDDQEVQFRRGCRLRSAVPGDDRQIALREPYSQRSGSWPSGQASPRLAP